MRKVTQSPTQSVRQVALITGAAQRIGAHIARTLHAAGMDLGLHFRRSGAAAQALKRELESVRPDSVLLLEADLHRDTALASLIDALAKWRGRLDLLVNNASTFYPTPLEQATPEQWDDLIGSNLRAPFFLTHYAAPLLRACGGTVVNLVDIHAERPLKDHPIYSIAKAGNAMMVKALARELGPRVRVNGIAPGTILWPEAEMAEEVRRDILERTALKRVGTPDDIARTLLFLLRDAQYITGQVIAVDGGRTVQQ
jgi:pteridine reductase